MSQPHRRSRFALLSSFRRRTALAAEVFWPGCVALILATLLACSCALHVLDRERTRLQEARWHDVLIGLEQQIEAELALGFDLEDSQRAERLLEGALRLSDDLRQVTVFDARGQTLFDTDRSAVGEQVRDTWRGAGGQGAWRVASGETIAIGGPLRGPSGTVVGQIALTLATRQWSYPWAAMMGASVAIAGVGAVLTLLPMAGLGRALQAALGPAAHRLDDAETRVAKAEDALRATPPTS